MLHCKFCFTLGKKKDSALADETNLFLLPVIVEMEGGEVVVLVLAVVVVGKGAVLLKGPVAIVSEVVAVELRSLNVEKLGSGEMFSVLEKAWCRMDFCFSWRILARMHMCSSTIPGLVRWVSQCSVL